MSVPVCKRTEAPTNLQVMEHANRYLAIVDALLCDRALKKPVKEPQSPQELERYRKMLLEREKTRESYRHLQQFMLECWTYICHANGIQDCNATNSKMRYELQEKAYGKALAMKGLLNHSANCYHLSKKKYKRLNEGIEPLLHSLKGWQDWELERCRAFYEAGKISKTKAFLKEID